MRWLERAPLRLLPGPSKKGIPSSMEEEPTEEAYDNRGSISDDSFAAAIVEVVFRLDGAHKDSFVTGRVRLPVSVLMISTEELEMSPCAPTAENLPERGVTAAESAKGSLGRSRNVPPSSS